MYYESSLLLSKNRLLNFLIGNRGAGKSYHFKCKCVQNFLTKGEQFVWVRRYNSELNDIRTWSNDIAKEFPNVTIEANKKHIKINGEVAGYVGALSTSQRLKSVPYPLVTMLVFDEFLIDKGSLRYINGEVELFLELYETIFRLRENARVIFIGNAISVVNPYFKYFNIKPDITKRFTMNKLICIDMYTNQDYIKVKKNTRFGQLIDSTQYGAYAIENQFLRDDYSFILDEIPNKLDYHCTLVFNGSTVGAWIDTKEQRFVILDRHEPDCERKVAFTFDDLDEKGFVKKSTNILLLTDILKYNFYNGNVFYDTIETKSLFYDIIKTV